MALALGDLGRVIDQTAELNMPQADRNAAAQYSLTDT
jgi:hypothetical protein